MLCLKCKHLSPPGSTYCTHCPDRRTFNGVVCGGGHRSSVGTRICGTCGSPEFSEYVWGIPTGWIARFATVAILVYIWKVGLAHGDQLLPILGSGVAYTFGFLTNSDSSALGHIVRTVLAYSFLGWVIGMWLHVLPGQGGALGRLLRGIPSRYWQTVTRLLPKLLGLAWRGVMKISGLATKKVPVPSSAKAKMGKEE